MLESYREKRKFDVTPEPEGGTHKRRKKALRFVVQMHDASHLHYDFRLEAGGVLKSWAVPKGPSMNPEDKHLAVMVEDHPTEYATFEGTIPAGEYGAGQVIVWDEGTYEPVEIGIRTTAEKVILNGIDQGKVHIRLKGSKLKGEFVLVKMKPDGKDWLLRKVDDAYSTKEPITSKDLSVRTSRSIADLKAGVGTASCSGSHRAKVPQNVQPMLASEVSAPFSSSNWTFELKLDGIRIIAIKDEHSLRMLSRNGNEVASKFPTLAFDLAALPYHSFVLDGEIVLFDDQGRPTFEGLMEHFKLENQSSILKSDADSVAVFCVFDVLFLEGTDLKNCPYGQRREILDKLTLAGERIRIVDSYPTSGEELFVETEKLGLEGVVGKRLSSTYQEGKRSTDWLKVKSYHSEEFYVCGFTEGKGGRKSTFGALILGQKNSEGSFEYVGNVGGGFSEDQLKSIRDELTSLIVPNQPFVRKPVIEAKATWVIPKHLAEVRFMAWTKEKHLRFPIFLRMRYDKEVFVVDDDLRDSPTKCEAYNILEALDDKRSELQVTVEGCKLHLTHLDKELWPAVGKKRAITKRDLLRYYAQISDAILPHLRDRPISFVRHPDGILSSGFFQKHPLPGMPDFVQRVKIWSEHSNKALDWILCNDLPTLLWLGQMGTIEIHPWYSRISREPEGAQLGMDFETAQGLDESTLNYPDYIVFDLDPNLKGAAKKLGDARAFDVDAWKHTATVAIALKTLLDSLKLRSYVKTSGKMGLHIFLPLERQYDYDEVRAIAEQFGHQLEKQMPDEVTMVWSVKKRPEAVFFDHNQNVRGKTLACVYSPRVAPSATVSFPISWSEISESNPQRFDIFSAPQLLLEQGERWKRLLGDQQMLSLK